MHDLAANGFELVAGVLDGGERRDLVVALGLVEGAGRRGVLVEPAVREWAQSARLQNLVRPYLNGEPRAVRAIYFNKTAAANWMVPWHQDLTLALRKRAEVEGFGPWSVKEGVPHVQPPVALLEQMLTVRVHLDDADETNGALRVLPGSHREGRLSAERIAEWRETTEERLCRARAGDALLMRPLLLHASGRATGERQRRVLHLEYAAFALPEPLEWEEAGGE